MVALDIKKHTQVCITHKSTSGWDIRETVQV